eukprot:267282-Pyramimonas_sp.AAC.1
MALSACESADAAGMFFDFAAAFPSIEHRSWTWFSRNSSGPRGCSTLSRCCTRGIGAPSCWAARGTKASTSPGASGRAIRSLPS